MKLANFGYVPVVLTYTVFNDDGTVAQELVSHNENYEGAHKEDVNCPCGPVLKNRTEPIKFIFRRRSEEEAQQKNRDALLDTEPASDDPKVLAEENKEVSLKQCCELLMYPPEGIEDWPKEGDLQAQIRKAFDSYQVRTMMNVAMSRYWGLVYPKELFRGD